MCNWLPLTAYSLTEAGIQVLPVMVALGNWGLAHRHGDDA